MGNIKTPMESTDPSLLSWIVGGLGVLVCYVVVSNTLYFLMGARLLQCLPGVNIRGFTGTLRIAFLLVLSVAGIAVWSIRTIGRTLHLPIENRSLSDEIRRFIYLAAKTLGKKIPTNTEAIPSERSARS